MRREEKDIILRSLKQKNLELIIKDSLVFENDSNGLKKKEICDFLETLYLEFDEDSPDVQQNYYLMLDKIIDGVVDTQYDLVRKHFSFANIWELNSYVLSVFKRIRTEECCEKFENGIEDLARYLSGGVNEKLVDYYCLRLKKLYGEYKSTSTLSKDNTTGFYNEILNMRRNLVVQNEKSIITEELKETLPLTKRCINSLEVGSKLRKIDDLMSTGQYDLLKTTVEEVKRLLEGVHLSLNSSKKLKKVDGQITEEQFEKLDELFLKNDLTGEAVADCLGVGKADIWKMVIKKYNGLKLNFLERVNVDGREISCSGLGYNYNNYMIVSKNKYYDNLADLVLSLTPGEMKKIVENVKKYDNLRHLVPLANLTFRFDTKCLKNVLVNFCEVNSLLNEGSKEKTMGNNVKFYDVLKLSSVFSSVDNVVLASLGVEVIDKILNDRVGCCDPRVYLEAYVKMLTRNTSYLPPVSGEFGDYVYESFRDDDVERLLIGKNCFRSCIDPNMAGSRAFYKCLTEKDGDVILIKNKEDKSFAARALMFRKGNYVVIAPIHDRVGIAEEFYGREFLDQVAGQLIANDSDNIEYVFCIDDCDFLEGKYPLVYDEEYLSKGFPHADLSNRAYLLAHRREYYPGCLKPEEIMASSYVMKRAGVKGKDQVTDFELTQLKALSAFMVGKDSKGFNLVSKEDYSEVYKGQDWYIGVKSTGEEVVALPVGDLNQKWRQEEEMNLIRTEFLKDVSQSCWEKKKVRKKRD